MHFLHGSDSSWLSPTISEPACKELGSKSSWMLLYTHLTEEDRTMRCSMFRWLGFILLAAWCTGSAPGVAQTRIGAINTNFRWLGPDDKIVIERYDDPRVAAVSCYLSRAQTGGIRGGIGVAEDPSRFSIACRAVGPVEIPSNLPKSEVVGFSSAALFFKTFQIHRMYDAEKNVLIYTVVSTRLINGSPFNSISVVPVSAG